MVLSGVSTFHKAWALYTNCESPMIVALSMSPTLHRGDILFLSNLKAPIEIGNICVYKIHGRNLPIVHRVIHRHDSERQGQQQLMTKGDNNALSDLILLKESNYGRQWVLPNEVIGCVQGLLPHFGIFTVYMTDHTNLKYALLGTMGLLVFLYG
ncbi:hypothetical protein DFQ27_006811 [Actinomortierella ambigua]|uniref:Signal peptidase complex catalytic subunit SEC11 n=1 Tax=Actinomortierella ambigua TaxID=1343610 RepID=A0A9P6PY99_9FUNG|nr:hypothetical protein DFQ27_006811 [Actinomortierella ambigua]